MENTMENKQSRTKSASKTKKLVVAAMLGAISGVLMLLEFYMPPAPAFISMDFSDLPVILGGFILGPGVGTLIIVIKILLNFLLNGTITAGVGELANFVLSLSYMLPAVLLYRKLRTRGGAVVSLITGTVIVSIAAVLMNTFVMFPVYAKAFKMPIEAIIGMGTQVIPGIHDMFTLMLFSILPFNLLKYTIVSVVTFLVYKRLAKFIRNIL